MRYNHPYLKIRFFGFAVETRSTLPLVNRRLSFAKFREAALLVLRFDFGYSFSPRKSVSATEQTYNGTIARIGGAPIVPRLLHFVVYQPINETRSEEAARLVASALSASRRQSPLCPSVVPSIRLSIDGPSLINLLPCFS